jgi:hypothetical protein
MANTIDDLKEQALTIKNASQTGENTANRVGTLFYDIVDNLIAGKYEFRYKNSKVKPTKPADGSDGTTGGWAKEPTDPHYDEGELTWMTQCYYSYANGYGKWSTPIRITGANGNNEEVGMLSFLSPLINSNIEEKNKKFYKKTLNKKANEFTDDNVDNYKNIEYENSESLHEYKGFWDKGSRTKYAKGTRKLRISKKNSFGSKGFNNYSNVQKLPKMGNKYSFYNNKNNKYNIPEISELKKNRYFSRTKTNLKSKIVARDVSSKSKKSESNVDQLISKLKKHYS